MSKSKKEIQLELSSCYFSQYGFALLGTIFAVGFGYKYKSYKPLVVGLTTGTILDLAYGKFYACKQLEDDYNEMVKNLEKK